jgi:hypothetical protein
MMVHVDHCNDFDGSNSQCRGQLDPDIAAIARLDRGGLIITAAGDGNYDFVSRYFAPPRGLPKIPRDRKCALRTGPLLGQAAQ